MATFTWTGDSVVELAATSSVHPIHAEIRNLRGQASVDIVDGAVKVGPDTGAWIEADVDQLLTGKKLEDMALRKQIDAKKFPTVVYEVRSVDGGPNEFKITGAFTFHGQTQEFTENATASYSNGKLVVEAEHSFNIEDFGVKPFKILTMKIHPDVHLKVHLVGAEG